jgi:hypothetical protein
MTRLTDGFATLIHFSQDNTVEMEEVSVTPPGVEGGGENNTSTMQNSTWRTRQPKKLKTLTESSLTVSYDVVAYTKIIAMVNINQFISVIFPDGTVLAFYGWLDSFVPGELVEGEQPTAEITLIPSNQDLTGVEAAPIKQTVAEAATSTTPAPV